MTRASATRTDQTAPPRTGQSAAAQADESTRRTATLATRGRGRTPAWTTQSAGPMVLGRYRLTERLGAGAFGIVWAARDERLERDVAVKVVPRLRVNGGRFEREARAAARLSHPAIVTLYEAAIDDEGAYLVSELVDGATLDELLDAGRLSDHDIVRIAIALCDALAHAHEQGVVHRDVKPSNILVAEHPTTPAYPAKLTDFGVARVIGGDSLTRTGDVVGTAAYMAPEQAEGREAGAASDLYGLALVTYEALTGVNPVQRTTAAVRARRLGAHLPPLRRQRRELPQALGCGIDLALRPRPRERGRIDELRQALEASLPQLADMPGVVQSGWSRRDRESAPAPDPDAEQFAPPEPANAPPLTRPAWAARAGGAAAAALFTAWVMPHLVAKAPIAPAGGATLVAIAVLLLPRLGWLAALTALASAAAITHHAGAALLIVLAAIPGIVMLPRTGTSWALGAAAPLLGAAGLAGAWPALTARACGSAWRRAAVAAAGWSWIALLAPVAGRTLYVKLPPGGPPGHEWTASLNETVHAVLVPMLKAGTLNAAPVWAVAALVLPWLIRGRSLVSDTVVVGMWAAATAFITQAVIAASAPGHAAQAVPTAIIGGIASAVVALTPTLVRALRRPRDAKGPRAELA